MKNEKVFFKCQHCGNIITYVHNAGPVVICCGEKMQEIKPNTSDGAKEKHVPAAVREGNKLKVTVGSAAHPMTEEHHIAWIIAAEGDRTQRVTLQPTGAPSAEFVVCDGPVTVYAYCNLHGLWVTEI
ncbi:MAG: desulfoferrodoxin [Treponema sp.]|nr:desulfoferrodoxin [Treponema sp.]